MTTVVLAVFPLYLVQDSMQENAEENAIVDFSSEVKGKLGSDGTAAPVGPRSEPCYISVKYEKSVPTLHPRGCSGFRKQNLVLKRRLSAP